MLSYVYISPIFFASIGLQVVLPAMEYQYHHFLHYIGNCGYLDQGDWVRLWSKLCGYKNYQCMRIGVGMISRGEVALILASKGAAIGLLGSNFLGPVVLVVIITTIITPILLKPVFKKGPPPTPSCGKRICRFL